MYKAEKDTNAVRWDKILKTLMYIWTAPETVTYYMISDGDRSLRKYRP